ncbi:MAG: SMP-30/gluconolactonase/LRE family protein [Spirochaetota bacterium]
MKRKALVMSVGFISVFCFVFLFQKNPINPQKFDPPKPIPFSGALQTNEELKKSLKIAEGRLNGPESIAFRNGFLYTGTADGWIVRVSPDGNVEKYAKTQGRVLGLQFAPTGSLFACDAYRGLLEITPNRQVIVLSNSANKQTFKFTEDLDISKQGIVYFTDASDTYNEKDYLYDLLEARPHGRLLAYNPTTRKTRVLQDKLYFANGVALSQDESFLLVSETYRYRILRYWLQGEKKGQSEIFLENLPGFPDNITSNAKGNFYVALYTLRNPKLDFLHRHPKISSQMAKIPRFLWPKPQAYGLVLRIDEAGKIEKSFHDTDGSNMTLLTSAIEIGNFLYLGTMYGSQIGKFPLQ